MDFSCSICMGFNSIFEEPFTMDEHWKVPNGKTQ
jgi:hypothetical protein